MEMLPVALEGLSQLGVDSQEAETLIAVIEERVRSGQTASRWQKRTLQKLDSNMERRDALAVMLSRYVDLSHSGLPVSDWPIDS